MHSLRDRELRVSAITPVLPKPPLTGIQLRTRVQNTPNRNHTGPHLLPQRCQNHTPRNRPPKHLRHQTG